MTPSSSGLFRYAQWLLLGLLLSLALSFWLRGALFGKNNIEAAHIDQHRLHAVQTFEQAITLQAPGEAPPAAPSLENLRTKFPCADAERLDALLRQLRVIETRLVRDISEPGKTLHLDAGRWNRGQADCDEALWAAAWLAEAQGQNLEKLEWPGLTRPKYDTPMQVPPSTFKTPNPWRDPNGCVYLGPLPDQRLPFLQEQRGNQETCPKMAPPGVKTLDIARHTDNKKTDWPLDDRAWMIPEDLEKVLAPLSALRVPEGETYHFLTAPPPEDAAPDASRQAHYGPNQIPLHKNDQDKTDVGFNVYLTLNPATQALAQQWVSCYAGRRSVCGLLGLDAQDPLLNLAAQMYESAAVRMAAVAVIDVASGKIEALGSAHTPCYQQDHDGPRHEAACPDAPFRPRYDNDRLLNHALYVDALPASTVKPILALGFLQDNPEYRSGGGLADLAHDLKTSNSEDFLDRLFCRDGKPAKPWRECQRPQRAQEAARLLGWNLGCAADNGSLDCARWDVLFGRQSGGLQAFDLPLLYGRLFTQPDSGQNPEDDAASLEWADADSAAGGGFRLMKEFRFDESFANACSSGAFCPNCGKHTRWRRCKGVGGDIANEGWGQGEARSTPVGVAGMLARLAAAANGAATQAYPHLVDHIGDAQGKPFALLAQRQAEPEPLAIAPDLARLVLQGMTSHQPGGTADDACADVFGNACAGIGWIAGKTGTPPFRFDETPLAAIKQQCLSGDKPKDACNVLPYKWYVAAFKTQGEADAPYDKAIAVLTERNWYSSGKQKGLVQSPGDREANMSAQLAFRLMKALRQETASPPPPAAPAQPAIKPAAKPAVAKPTAVKPTAPPKLAPAKPVAPQSAPTKPDAAKPAKPASAQSKAATPKPKP
ncbi:MAG: hypothetical protein ACKN9T_12990 [Candidatus Methylumidiphilus sp.]